MHNASSQERLLSVGDGPPGSHRTCPPKKGSWPRPQATSTGTWWRERSQSLKSHMEARGAPHGPPPTVPTAHYTSSQERGLWIGDGPPPLHTPRPHKTRSWPGPQAPSTGGWGRASPECQTPLTEARPCPQRITQAHKRLYCGLVTGPHVRTPRAHGKRAVGPGLPPQARVLGGGEECPSPDAPHRGTRASPKRPCAAPQCAKPAHKSVRFGVDERSSHPHPPVPMENKQRARNPRVTDGPFGVGECRAPDTPHEDTRCPPGRPHASCIVRPASSEERALWDW